MRDSQFQWDKSNGFIPAIIQDNMTKRVLMLGYMNKEAFQKTHKTRKVWFFSRSRKRLWMKGEESGNKLSVVSMQADCDSDALLVRVNPTGPTCHTGAVSCFGDEGKQDNAIIDLYKIIEGRKRAMPQGSYTASLFKAGLDRICTKVAEESGEVIKAATKESKKRLAEEASDLLYHLLVLLAARDVSLRDITRTLRDRRQ